MLNYGFDDLRLVQPRCSPADGETRAQRSCVARLLVNRVHDTIQDATSDCSAVVGTSGKRGRKKPFRHFLFHGTWLSVWLKQVETLPLCLAENRRPLDLDLEQCDFFVFAPNGRVPHCQPQSCRERRSVRGPPVSSA